MYDMLPNKAFQTFFTVMTIVAVAYLLRALCYYVMTYWGHTFGIRVETDMRADLFRHLQQLDFDFYDRNRTGSLMSRLTGDLFEITELAHHGPEDLLISTLTIVGALIMMFTIEWRLALVVFILLPIFIGIIMKQRTNLSTTSKNVKVRLASINSDIESSLSGTKTSKAFANENVERERFDNVNSGYRNSKKDILQGHGPVQRLPGIFHGL